jgi:hypothetical protein
MGFIYNFNSHIFDSPGFLTCSVPDCVREELEETVKKVQDDAKNYKDFRNELVGHMEQEYEIPITPNIKYLVETLSYEYDKVFNNGIPSDEVQSQFSFETDEQNKILYELKLLWINFARKYDFNPLHVHQSVFSFVIWVSVPYDLQEELSRYKANYPSTSLFSFTYINSLGKICSKKLPIDKTWEWKMAFFPASLHHSVNPFYTSDEYRISIAGNVYCGLSSDLGT